jgi:hypothetical protein
MNLPTALLKKIESEKDLEAVMSQQQVQAARHRGSKVRGERKNHLLTSQMNMSSM